MGIHGVRRPFNPVEGEMDAFGFPDRNHLGVKLQRPLPTAKLSDAIFLAADPFLRHRRIELEWEPTHSNLLALKGSDGPFEPPLADVAPRADHVGDHVNGEIHDNSKLRSSNAVGSLRHSKNLRPSPVPMFARNSLSMRHQSLRRTSLLLFKFFEVSDHFDFVKG